MIKIFYIVNGSNDLYYPLSKNFNDLKEIFKKKANIEVYCLYKLVKSDPLNIWRKVDGVKDKDREGAFKYANGIFEDLVNENYYKSEVVKGREVLYLDIKKFLRVYLKEDEYNVVIISGHGGPFQSLLDLNTSPGISINTLELITEINEFNIKLLFLDMCSMNYIEIIYELLSSNKVEKIITYKNFAPFEGIDYKEFIEYIEGKKYIEKFRELKGPLVYIDKSMLKEIDEIKKKMNLIIINGIEKKERRFQEDIEKFRAEKILIGLQTEEGKLTSGNTFNYIKYFLNDELERELYGQYKFSENNLWSIITRKRLEVKNTYRKNIIPIEKDGILNIIDIHSNILNQNKLEEIFLEYIKRKNEEEIYFES
ncbi:clostripain-related cysteine peptidase [Cetobacterium sp.]|uniref:clostripain-related cysteine peptidase n=1 Tax=Cetobacterium sp. TaxID=2071632 RepID=UPI003F4188EA